MVKILTPTEYHYFRPIVCFAINTTSSLVQYFKSDCHCWTSMVVAPLSSKRHPKSYSS